MHPPITPSLEAALADDRAAGFHIGRHRYAPITVAWIRLRSGRMIVKAYRLGDDRPVFFREFRDAGAAEFGLVRWIESTGPETRGTAAPVDAWRVGDVIVAIVAPSVVSFYEVVEREADIAWIQPIDSHVIGPDAPRVFPLRGRYHSDPVPIPAHLRPILDGTTGHRWDGSAIPLPETEVSGF